MKTVAIVLVTCFPTRGALAQTTTPDAGDALTDFMKCGDYNACHKRPGYPARNSAPGAPKDD